MKKILALLVIGMFLMLPAPIHAEETTTAPSRFGLLVEQWKDRLQLLTTRDEAKKAELELKFTEKYDKMLEKVESLPENANKERIREVLEERKSRFGEALQKRMEKKEEIRARFEEKIQNMEEKTEKTEIKQKLEEKKDAVQLRMKNTDGSKTEVGNMKIETQKVEMRKLEKPTTGNKSVKGVMTSMWGETVGWLGL
jgi:hypothetical protein